MIYLNKDNLITGAFERFIDESTDGDNTDILDEVELINIELIKSYIGSRYNVTLIFDEDEPIINAMLVSILTKLVLYDIVRRNAARKVPTDYKEEYDKAIALLEKIATGRIPVSGLPFPTDGDGNPVESNTLWGNNTNEKFYI